MADLQSVFNFFINLVGRTIEFLSSIEFWFSDLGSVSLTEIIFGGIVVAAVIALFYKGARS